MKRLDQLTQLTAAQLATDDIIGIRDQSAGQTKYITVKDLTGAPDFGWQATGESWAFSSYSTVLHTGVITVPTDATVKYSKNMWVRFSQTTGGTKYGKILAVTATTMTVAFPNGTTFTNEALTSPVYSGLEQPLGAPQDADFVYSQANSGGAGGTIYFRYFEGLKEAWLQTGALNTTGAGPKTFAINWPTGFFSAVHYAISSIVALTTYAEQYTHFGAGVGTTTSTFYIVTASTGGAASTSTVHAVQRGV